MVLATGARRGKMVWVLRAGLLAGPHQVNEDRYRLQQCKGRDRIANCIDQNFIEGILLWITKRDLERSSAHKQPDQGQKHTQQRYIEAAHFYFFIRWLSDEIHLTQASGPGAAAHYSCFDPILLSTR